MTGSGSGRSSAWLVLNDHYLISTRICLLTRSRGPRVERRGLPDLFFFKRLQEFLAGCEWMGDRYSGLIRLDKLFKRTLSETALFPPLHEDLCGKDECRGHWAAEIH